jgi:hypothetical protein
MGHLAPHVVECLLDDTTIERLPGGEPPVEVERGELGVVVEHLLEVRHEPLAVHRVAVEAPAELVVDAAAGHPVERELEHLEAARVCRAAPDAEHRLPGHGLRELGCLAEAAVALVELAAQPHVGPDQDVAAQPARGRGEPPRLPHRLDELPAGLEHLAAAGMVGLRDGAEQTRERGHTVPVFRREVRASVERDAVRGEEDGHRPAPAPGHRLHRLHVDLVDVRPLLAIDLDRYEELVHQGRDLVVLERLALHDVAPVAGRVAHREQHRLVLAAGQLEGFRAPGIPVDRIVGVLEQVGARLGGETIGGAGLGHAGRAVRPG